MKQLLLAGIAFLLLAISCNQANKKKESQSTITSDIKMEDTIVDSAAFEQSPTLPGEQKQKEPTGKPSQSPESKPDWNKKIIKTSTLNIEVKEYAEFNQAVHLSAEKFGGYIAD